MEVPGTVSRILWHFTGGPTWNKETKELTLKPKKLTEAYGILKLILTSKELKTSDYLELFKVSRPASKVYNKYSKKYFKVKGEEHIFNSSPVCCLADIPIQYLHYHAQRYGKCAIGFYRDSAINRDFNPVFYSVHDSEVLNIIMDAMNYSQLANMNKTLDFFYNLTADLEQIYDEAKREEEEVFKNDIDKAVSCVRDVIEEVKYSLDNLTAYIKSFNHKEFYSIYCEREWRSLFPFTFEESDIAMVIVPKEKGCYDELIESRILTRKIPIVPWEDLIEH